MILTDPALVAVDTALALSLLTDAQSLPPLVGVVDTFLVVGLEPVELGKPPVYPQILYPRARHFPRQEQQFHQAFP